MFVDANIFMYAAGDTHPHKQPSVELLEAIATDDLKASTNVEVLQEILHRYRSIDRWDEGRSVFDHARRIVPIVLPVELPDLEQAHELLEEHDDLSARDALHAATCLRYDIETICSYDQGVDRVDGLTRLAAGEALES